MIVLLLLMTSFPPAWSGALIPPQISTPVEHYTDVAWQDAAGNPAGVSYNVYKAVATCADAGATFKLLVSGIQSGPNGLTYRDTTVAAGETACYYVTSVFGAEESAPSAKVEATTPTPWAHDESIMDKGASL